MKKKTFVNTSNIHTTYKFLGEELCNKMELEINRLLLLLLFSVLISFKECHTLWFLVYIHIIKVY